MVCNQGEVCLVGGDVAGEEVVKAGVYPEDFKKTLKGSAEKLL